MELAYACRPTQHRVLLRGGSAFSSHLKSTLEQAAETPGEPLFEASNGPTGDPTPVTFLSDPDKLAALKAELQEKPLQIAVFCGALGRTRTCDLLIRSQTLYPAELRAHWRCT
jgi:hypothetical protein